MELQTLFSICLLVFNHALGIPKNLPFPSVHSTRQTETTINILSQTFTTSEDMGLTDQHVHNFTHNFSTDQPTSPSATSQGFSTTESGCQEMEQEYKPRVYNGKDVEPRNKYSSVGMIRMQIRNKSYRCTGTIIDEKHILTAAHCFISKNGFQVNPRDVKVIVGNNDTSGKDKNESIPQTTYSVHEIILHENYNEGNPQNDIGILLLAGKLDLQSRKDISSVCLPTSSSNSGEAIIVGWGFMGPRKHMATKLQEGLVSVNDICFTNYPFASFTLDPKMVCLYGTTQHSSACKGDSGGPVMKRRNNRLEIIGIISVFIDTKGRQAKCASKHGVTIATNVFYYKEWIRRRVPNISC